MLNILCFSLTKYQLESQVALQIWQMATNCREGVARCGFGCVGSSVAWWRFAGRLAIDMAKKIGDGDMATGDQRPDKSKVAK